MPSIQDMLENFDASRLEELAESLLADVITDLAADDTPSCRGAASYEGATKRLLERVVGTESEQLESAQDSCIAGGHIGATCIEEHSINTPNMTHHEYTKSVAPVSSQTAEYNHLAPMAIAEEDDDTTLYGTYDEKTNCITIVMPDENLQLDEVVEEVQYCPSTAVSIISPIPDTYLDELSSLGHVSPAHSTLSSNVSLADAKALTVAESGYESLGSPGSSGSDLEPAMDFDDMWNDSFSELFPSLM